MWQKPSVWDPPIRFQRDLHCQPPSFPSIQDWKEGQIQVTANALPDESPIPDEESDDKTEVMESYPPLVFQDKAKPVVERDIEANSGSQQATAELPCGPCFRVPPLLVICPYCGDLQATSLPFAGPSYCHTCKQSLS